MIYSIVRHIFQNVESINGFGLFSFFIFFTFFAGVLVWAWRLKKNYLNHMSDLPLDGGECRESVTDKNQPR